jgi:hypothetical protein
MTTPEPENGAHRAEQPGEKERHIDPEPLAISSDDLNDFIDRYPTDEDDEGPDISTRVQPPL